MSYYAAGSRGGYDGVGTYLQEGRPLSYAPRFSGNPGGYCDYIQLGAGDEEAATTESGTDWAGMINNVLGAGVSLYQMTAQQKLEKQRLHQAERDRAAQLELAKTQSMYIGSGSIKPAAGSSVMLSRPGAATQGGGVGKTVVLVGGVLAAGVAAVMLTRKRRRR